MKSSLAFAILCLCAFWGATPVGWAQRARHQSLEMPTLEEAKALNKGLLKLDPDALAQQAHAEKASTDTQKALESASSKATLMADPSRLAIELPHGPLTKVPDLHKGSQVDPMKLAEAYKNQGAHTVGEPTFNAVVFVSLSMPAPSLERIGKEAKKIGAVVVLRGMPFGLAPGNYLKVVEALKPLASTGAALQINPEMFKQFAVSSVPTLVVTPTPVGDKGCSDGACTSSAAVVGDVSIGYGLERLAQRRDEIGRIARNLAQRL